MRLLLLACAALLGCGGPHDGGRGELAPPASAAASAAPSSQPFATPPTLGASEVPLATLSAEDEARLDAAVEEGIARGEYPGAVVVILRRDRVVLRKAYGARALKPSRVAMSVDTLFDLASLTKPIVSATAVMLLRERGELGLDDRLALHLPELGGAAADITVRQLLGHRAGLPAANDLGQYRHGRRHALEQIAALAAKAQRGRHLYSDLGYILLGELVARVSGEPLERFAERHIFAPLGMKDTTFTPTGELGERAAPSERRGEAWLRGQVHDPRAAALGGVAGHAGLFSTADDLGRFAAMLLRRGLAPPLLLSTRSIDLLAPTPPKAGGEAGAFALGYPRLDGGYGHTGFTGTSIWLDPDRGSALILLTSRLHPDGAGNVTRLRRAARAVLRAADEREPRVRVGVDELAATGFAALAGRRVGLVSHAAAIAGDGRRTVDVLFAAPQVKLVALFSPEHGFGAKEEGSVADAMDAATGLPIRSLYGPRRRPTALDLADVDTLVVDLQDAGARFYTYATTLGYMLEAAAEQHKRILVLDRPNPSDGIHLEGPLLEAGRESFVGYHSIPVRHGSTLGELGRLYARERGLDVDLEVVPMRGWRRQERFDQTGLRWLAPSPNLTSPTAASLYPGVALLELTNVSVGRGTARPFQRVGAPWIDPEQLLAALEAEALAGVKASPLRFVPSLGPHAGQSCHGLELGITDPERLRPVRLGLGLVRALHRSHPAFEPARVLTLLGSRRAFEALLRLDSLAAVEATWQRELELFASRRQHSLIY